VWKKESVQGLKMHENSDLSRLHEPILLKTKENKGLFEKKRLNICECE
jgi:hypothetical protein